MKNKFTILLLLLAGYMHAQRAFEGKGDLKVNIGANFQKGGAGIQSAIDFGLGQNFSYGFVANYLLSVNEYTGPNHDGTIQYTDRIPAFKDRFDAKFRINANIGSVLKIDEKLDVYPGLDLGLKNFGGHIGLRYFFSEGFGVYSEIGFPIAKYSNNTGVFDHLNNQFAFNIGASFNL